MKPNMEVVFLSHSQLGGADLSDAGMTEEMLSREVVVGKARKWKDAGSQVFSHI